MRVTRKDDGPSKIVLTIEGQAGDLEPIRRHVLSHFTKNVKVPGFRAGKAPENLIEKHVNQQALLDEFMEHALNELYRRAVEQENIRPLSTPNVQLKKFVPYSQLEFEVQTEVLGPIKLPNYKTIKQTKTKVQVTAKDVDEVIESLRQRTAERTGVTRPAKTGDEVLIDFSGSDKAGKPISGADGKDYPLPLGSNTFIPGFEENLSGAKAGDSRQFTVTFPKDYGVEALRGQKADFKVQLKRVSELKLPKVDDEFAKKVGPFANLKELKSDVKKQLTAERQSQADVEYQNKLVRKIAEKTQMNVPRGLVDEENRRMEEQEKQNLAYQGQTWQEHLKSEGITEEQHRQRNYPQAEERVKIGLILSEIAEREGVSVTPEEVDLRLQVLKGQYRDAQMQTELDKPENRRDIEARLMTEKTIQNLVAYASK
ncbi:MAG TPA: trigger factor [Candidatus Saccharimonadales bacterium]|nr:trigger factor [Candidatus Saccharimonadales bacterium]